MAHDNDDKDRWWLSKPKPERITLAQDGYPQSFGFGMFGNEYRRTWISRQGDALPAFKGKGKDR